MGEGDALRKQDSLITKTGCRIRNELMLNVARFGPVIRG